MRKLKRIFTGRTWLSVIAIVLLCVVCTGVVARVTDNFTEFDAKEVFARERNEANLLPAEYTGTMGNIGIGVEVNKDFAYALYEDAYRLKFRDPRAKYKLRILKMVR